MAIILGLDPGSLRAGYGVIRAEGDDLMPIAHGVLHLKGDSLAQRLCLLLKELETLFQRHRPQTAVIERVFLGKNADSAFKLGHARGVCLAAAARFQCQVAEYAPRSAKKIVTGHGSAEKEHVALVVGQLLNLKGEMALDASDALALAICHARELSREKILRGAEL